MPTQPTLNVLHRVEFPDDYATVMVLIENVYGAPRHTHPGLEMKSVFRSAARRTGLPESAPQSGAAPVSEKRIGLNRSPRRGYGY